MDHAKMACQLCVALATVLLSNKWTYAVHLTSNLHEQWQGSLDIAKYCARIKTIVDSLHGVD
jgi:hypothetical protein